MLASANAVGIMAAVFFRRRWGLVAAVTLAAGALAQEDAAALYGQSEALYRAGHYDEAAALLAKAYALQPDPALLFNLGRCYERAGQLAPAVDAYARYLEAEPQSKDRASVERSLATLRRQLLEIEGLKMRHEAELQELTALQLQERENAAQVRHSRATLLPKVAFGVGLAGLAAAGVLGGLCLERQSAAEAAPVQADAGY